MKRNLLLITCSFFLTLSAVAQPSKKAELFFHKGIELRNQNSLPEAMTAFKNALVFNKNYDSALAEIGNLFVKLRLPDSAVIFFRKALKINPLMVETHIAFGNLYRDMKPNYDSAIICYKNAIGIDSLNKLTFYSLAWCYNSKKEYDSAIYYAAKALDIDNGYRTAYSELAHAYHNSKKYEEGIEQFKKNMARSEIDLPYYYSGLIYTELKKKDEALKMAERLEKLNPKMAAKLKQKIDAMQ